MNLDDQSPTLLRKMDATFSLISKICLILSGTALVVMTAIFAWLVFGRYVLKVRTFMVVVSDLMMAIFGGMMFWYGIELTKFKWNTLIPLIQWSEGLRSLPLTVCGALVCLFSIGHLIRVCLGRDPRKDSIE